MNSPPKVDVPSAEFRREFDRLSKRIAANRKALVIGNDAYVEELNARPLRKCVNDAKKMAEALAHHGFDVTMQLNGTASDISSTIESFQDKLDMTSEVVIFLSGHGLQVSGVNYFLPIDSPILDIRSLSGLLDINNLVSGISKKTRCTILIVDACRNDPFTVVQSSLSAGSKGIFAPAQGLAYMEAEHGSYLAFACQPGTTASEGSSSTENSVFTAALLADIMAKGLSIDQLMTRATNSVVKATDGQRPWRNSSLSIDYYFSDRSEEDLINIVERPPILLKIAQRTADREVLKSIASRLLILQAEARSSVLQHKDFPTIDRFIVNFKHADEFLEWLREVRANLKAVMYFFAFLLPLASSALSSWRTERFELLARPFKEEITSNNNSASEWFSVQLLGWPVLGAALFSIIMGWLVWRYFDMKNGIASQYSLAVFSITILAQLVIDKFVSSEYSEPIWIIPVNVALLALIIVSTTLVTYIPLMKQRPKLDGLHLRAGAIAIVMAFGLALVAWVSGQYTVDRQQEIFLHRFAIYSLWQVSYALITVSILSMDADIKLKRRLRATE